MPLHAYLYLAPERELAQVRRSVQCRMFADTGSAVPMHRVSGLVQRARRGNSSMLK